MKLLRGPFSPGGAAAFFFFSWVLQMLFNSIVVGHLGLLKPLNYWQAAALLFLSIVAFAWSGRGLTRTVLGFLHLDHSGLHGLEVGLFFLFAWIFQVLFNSLIAGYFGLLAPLNYWQAAGLLFLIVILTFWMGFMSAPRREVKIDFSNIGKKIADEIKRFFEEW
ncbi:hypothetical protein ACVNPS_03450 [Candidatus Bipolaricaulota sp. J31]